MSSAASEDRQPLWLHDCRVRSDYDMDLREFSRRSLAPLHPPRFCLSSMDLLTTIVFGFFLSSVYSCNDASSARILAVCVITSLTQSEEVRKNPSPQQKFFWSV